MSMNLVLCELLRHIYPGLKIIRDCYCPVVTFIYILRVGLRSNFFKDRKKFCIRSSDTKKSLCLCPQFICLFFHLLTCTNPNIFLEGCQAMGKSSSLIFAFSAFRFVWPSYHLISLSSSCKQVSSCHNFSYCYVTNQSGKYPSNNESFITTTSHIFCDLK